MALTQAHSPPQGLSVWYVSFQNILPHVHSFKVCICVYINRARLLCGLLLSRKGTFSLQDAEVCLICLYLKKPLLMWIFRTIFSSFSLVSMWVVSDCSDFHHWPPVTGPLGALGTLLQAEMWNCCGEGFGHFTFSQALPDHALQHHDKFHTYQK